MIAIHHAAGAAIERMSSVVGSVSFGNAASYKTKEAKRNASHGFWFFLHLVLIDDLIRFVRHTFRLKLDHGSRKIGDSCRKSSSCGGESCLSTSCDGRFPDQKRAGRPSEDQAGRSRSRRASGGGNWPRRRQPQLRQPWRRPPRQ